MLTRFIRIQLVLFTVLTLVALVTLGWYYLRLPSMAGIGQYQLKADLPASGGLYRTANVTYRGITIGKVTSVEPTERGALATMSIADNYRIPVNATANVHSVSAIGEQYLDLVSEGGGDQYFAPGQTITDGTVPQEIGPALDAANRGLAVLPKEKISALLDETAIAVGDSARRCSGSSTAPRRWSVISGPTSTTSTTSSTTRRRSSTARSTPVTRSQGGHAI